MLQFTDPKKIDKEEGYGEAWSPLGRGNRTDFAGRLGMFGDGSWGIRCLWGGMEGKIAGRDC